LSESPSFWDHIQELRSRLIKALLGVAACSGLAFWQWERLWLWMVNPITSRDLNVSFIATNPMETMATSVKLSLIAGCLLSFPWVMWQIWRFAAPGLYSKEKRLFLGTFAALVLMFAVGAAFCYFVVLPAGLAFLATYMEGVVTQSWKQADFAAFTVRFVLAFGVLFELPVGTYVLGRLGLVTPRAMWEFSRFAVVIIFVVAALLTPGPDPVSQILMALPLCLLYLLSIGVCAVAVRGRGE
jgi:sec-independent protein translocase protein TatC